ncbi:MAG: hypothetical protein L3J75_08860 [Methylococcaceae bacterium]|nr:hypothetical protein [Methylococcaceae bacterium]
MIDNDSLVNLYMPVFVIENHKKRYNLIGTASAIANETNDQTVYINPQKATVYTQTRVFKTRKNSYTNLVYRIHFEKIPGGFIPFYLGQGKNSGLIVIITLNNLNKPILYTTVHTCGCYLAFVPTSYMPTDGFPINWDRRLQSVDFESLPGLLEYDETLPNREKTMILIRDGSHRVKDIWLLPPESLKKFKTSKVHILPLESLKKLPLKQHKTISFFETTGSRIGYVKGSYKIRERLLMSWWAFDSRIGEDKVFGKDKNDGILFYTSLKPWAREQSDMRDFSSFLKYWGWEL